MPALSLSLLGPVAITLDGQSLLPFRSVKVQALLIYLVVEEALGGQAAPQRDTLLGLLWPDMPETSARQNLRQTLYLLRQAIGEVEAADGAGSVPLLLSDRQTVRINSAAGYLLDVAAFLERVETGTPAALAEAAALYQGDFLADFFLEDSNEFEAWAGEYRAHLQRMALEALRQLAAHALAQGNDERAQRYARRQLELDDLRESAHRQLMTALARSDQRNAALAAHEAFRKQLRRELGVAPAAQTEALYERIRSGDVPAAKAARVEPASTAPARPHPPQSPTPFVGREVELAQITEHLEADNRRLVTLVGAGGMGKTRLALQAAAELAPNFADGVVFVPLAASHTADLFVTSVAGALGFALHGRDRPQRQLCHYWQGKQLLLVLDNFEHLLETTGLALEWLQAAPELKVLVTSQERLNVRAEWLIHVGGLAVPPAGTTGAIDDFAAVQLFVGSAQRVRPDFALNAQNKSHVVQICHLLRGMPLGIELAAAWTRLLPPEAIADEIEQNLDFLSTTLRDLPPRHRSLRAVFDYTWQRLEAEEREILQQLSVFRGNFTREAAAEVAGAALPLLAALVDKSLLQHPSPSRYEMHGLLRQYAGQQLAADPEMEAAVRRRHARTFATLLKAQETPLRGGDLHSALAIISGEIDNVRAAWAWMVEQGDPALLGELVVPLLLFYEVRSWFEEGVNHFRLAAARLQEASTPLNEPGRLTLGYLLAVQGWFTYRLARYEEAQTLLEKSLHILRQAGDQRGQAFALSVQALIFRLRGHYEEAQEQGEASLQLCQQFDEPLFKAFSLHNLGSVARVQSRYRQARQRYRESLALFKAIDNGYGTAFALISLGNIELRLGAFEQAEKSYEESRAMCERIGYQYGLAVAFRSLADARIALGKYAGIRELCRRSLAITHALADREGSAWAVLVLGKHALAQGDEEAAERLYERSLSIFRQVKHRSGVALALNQLGQLAWRTGTLERAREASEESLSIFEEIDHKAGQVRAHINLGRAASSGGEHAVAAAHFHRALKLAATIVAPPLILEALAAAAGLLLQQEQRELALHLISFVLQQPACAQPVRTQSERLLAGLEEPDPAPDTPASLQAWLVELQRHLHA